MAEDEFESVTVTVTIPKWAHNVLADWKAPVDHVGETVAERIAFISVEHADHIVSEELKAVLTSASNTTMQ